MIEIASPRLKRLFRDWEGWRRGREFPSRADFTPFDLKYMLGNLSLLDVTYDPLRFRYLIYATKLTQWMGYELTNKSVDDIPNTSHAALVREHCTEVVEGRVPTVHFRDKSFIMRNMPYNCEVLILPLSADGTTINMLISALVWDTE